MKKKQLKIGIDVTGIGHLKKTGTEIFISNLIERLKSDGNHKYILYSYSDFPEDFEVPNNFELKTCKLRSPIWGGKLMFLLWNSITLPLYILKDRPDLFISTNQMGPLFCPCKSMVVIHDISFITQQDCFTWWDRIVFTKFAKLSIERANVVVADSRSTQKDILNHYKIHKDKVKVIYLGYDRNAFKINSQDDINEIRAKYNLHDEKYIIFIGTLQKRKNLETLICALNELKMTDKFSHKLVVVGQKGWLYNEIFETIKKYNLENDVLFTGYIPRSDLSPLTSGAEVFILPSLYEGFGIPILEAMASGVPVIASNISSLPEVVGDAGLLIDNPKSRDEIAQKLRQVINNKELRDTLIKKGLNQTKKFSWEKTGREYLDIMQSLISRNEN